ncbi:MAG: hypothetical protein NPIRA02_27220 [Nitrospirales bacterium]|nr:MAG: hypothetical protein NPIRA02_27220 [Nitrospirales bacterium]
MLEKLRSFISSGENCSESHEAFRWQERVWTYLSTAIGETKANDFAACAQGDNIFDDIARQVGFLDALVQSLGASNADPDSIGAQGGPASSVSRVFVVHGHDSGIKDSVCRFLEKISLNAVVLHDQPNEGLTIVEKFERHSDVAFAVVLLTPDDLGALATDPEHRRPRARQNVVLELGYFLGRLGRGKVCALYKGNIETPSDVDGVVYVKLDEDGAWRNALARELDNAGLPINCDGLL